VNEEEERHRWWTAKYISTGEIYRFSDRKKGEGYFDRSGAAMKLLRQSITSVVWNGSTM
jgi:hypothetical protein